VLRFAFFYTFEIMAKIRKECLGIQMKSPLVNKWFTIQEGQEPLYKALGFDVFETKKKPAKNADSLQGATQPNSGNSDGAGN
jgi:hypothetical protein